MWGVRSTSAKPADEAGPVSERSRAGAGRGEAGFPLRTKYTVKAHNAATASENRIHSDDVAKQYGFRGGLVPGVTVYAYMTRLPVERWGREWIERGEMGARFVAPLYEGETAAVEAEETDGGRLDLRVINEEGNACATGWARLPDPEGVEPPPVSEYPVAPLPGTRPAASPSTFAGLTVLGSVEG